MFVWYFGLIPSSFDSDKRKHEITIWPSIAFSLKDVKINEFELKFPFYCRWLVALGWNSAQQ